MLKEKKIAVLGVGKIGEALISGLINKGALQRSNIVGTVKHETSIERAKSRLGIVVTIDNADATKNSDVVIIAVKPQNMSQVLHDISSSVNKGKLIISVATSVSTSFIEDGLKNKAPVIRAMPNTPSIYDVGMTGICTGKNATAEHTALASAIFESVGRVVAIDESLMDAVTALSASGPAFIYVIIESLAEAGVKLGLPRETATLLAAQTVLGSAHMVLTSGSHPALLKDMVTTPAGCTVDGLMELEEGRLRVTLIKAVVKAAERAAQLVNTQQNGIG